MTATGEVAAGEIDLFTLSGTRVTAVSDAFALLLGRPAAEMHGRELIELVHPDDRADVAEQLDELDGDTALECRFVGPAGQALYVESVARPAGGAWQVAGTDTADLARLLAERRALRARLDLAVGQAMVAMWDLDPATGELGWEPGAELLLGLEAGAVPGSPEELVALAAPDDRDALTAAFERLGREEATEVGIRVGSEAGVRHLSLRGRVLGRGRRRRDERIVGLLIDITVEKALEEQLLRMSISDGLTGVRNRRGFDQALRGEARRTAKAGEPLALLMLDLDHFKAFNDTYGHVLGDAALVSVARALTAALRQEGDVLARYGGEEFAVVLPGADRTVAEQVADRLLDAVRRVRLRQAPDWSPTVSIGVAARAAGDTGVRPSELLASADAALYRAKDAGRDRRC